MHSGKRFSDPDAAGMVVVGPAGVVIDKAELEVLLRTQAEKLVAQVAIEIFRARRRLDRLSGEVRTSVKALEDSITRMEDVLIQHDVRLHTHDGESYDNGLAVEVIEASGATDHQVVTETITPTVTWQGRVVSRAQVVIGPSR